MKRLKASGAFVLMLMLVPASLTASSHREAPISALDHSADVTDWYAFVSYDHPDRVTMILNVDGLLEPANGPNYFPFDPNVIQEMNVDNDHDGVEDITFQFCRCPGEDHYALGNLAKVRIRQRRYEEAASLLRERYRSAAHAENLFDLAEALLLAGHQEEGKQAFAEFEAKSLLETYRADNSNRELILYYCDYVHEPGKALAVAEREFGRREDIYTLDSYAWALHRNGRHQEARRVIERALAVGIRDARLFRHAGEIALEGGDRASAEKYLRQAAELNTVESETARSILAGLGRMPGQ